MDDPFKMVETVESLEKKLKEMENAVQKAKANAIIFDNLRTASQGGITNISFSVSYKAKDGSAKSFGFSFNDNVSIKELIDVINKLISEYCGKSLDKARSLFP